MKSWFFRMLPRSLKNELRRIRYRYQIKRGRFKSEEVEFEILNKLIAPGEVVIDIGANVGHYTLLMSQLAGPYGRVLAFEPIPRTFDLLSSNALQAKCQNITLLNCAVTDAPGIVGFTIPEGNYYQSHLSRDGDVLVFGLPLSSVITSGFPVSFIKIDAEGADEQIISSLPDNIWAGKPIIMTELSELRTLKLAEKLSSYYTYKLDGSHNSFLVPGGKSELFKRLGFTRTLSVQ